MFALTSKVLDTVYAWSRVNHFLPLCCSVSPFTKYVFSTLRII